MTIIFFGNSKYSTIAAEVLQKRIGLAAIVTIPDSIGNRGKHILSPVKVFAHKNNITVIESEELSEPVIKKIRSFHPDFLVVADYRLILPEILLKIPKYASLNIHHSLLPQFRGTSPAPAAILSGVKTTGVTIIKMNKEIDSGDILKQVEYELRTDETTASLLKKLNELGSEAAADVMQKYKDIVPREQIESEATFTKRMSKNDGHIELNKIPEPMLLDRMIRAYYPWPGVWTKYQIHNNPVRIKLLPEAKIQVEGKNPVSYKDFMNGYEEGRILLEKLRLI